MPSSNPHPNGAIDPRAPIEALAHWLLGTAVECLLGLALGVLVARVMRRRNLHWSWVAGGLPLIALAGSGIGGSTLTLSIAVLFAARRGRRWQREDAEAGADLGLLAARRRGPLDFLLRLARMAALALRQTASGERWLRGGELTLGLDERGRTVSIPFGGGGGQHTLVVGATGSGKTVTQTWIAARAIEHGLGVIVIDPKGDRAMRGELQLAALEVDRPFVEWTPAGECIYNPFARGGASEIADKALAGEHFTEPHYQRQAQRYLGHVARALHGVDAEISLQAIVEHMDPGRLEALARNLPDDTAQATFAYLDSLSARQQNELAGMRDRLAILAESDVAPWLDPQHSDGNRLDLLAAVRARAIVYFSLESDRRPLLTQMLGAAIVQDLQTAVAALQGGPVQTLVVIDEFSAIAADQVVRLFGRARSAGVSLLLGTQELSDLKPPGQERMLDQVLGNLSVLIAHRQVVPGSAELVGSVAGTRGTWKVSRRSDGATTRVRTREPAIDANQVMSLGPGWGAVIVLGERGGARIARIFSPGRRR